MYLVNGDNERRDSVEISSYLKYSPLLIIISSRILQGKTL
jgi:hypothetical protein